MGRRGLLLWYRIDGSAVCRLFGVHRFETNPSVAAGNPLSREFVLSSFAVFAGNPAYHVAPCSFPNTIMGIRDATRQEQPLGSS